LAEALLNMVDSTHFETTSAGLQRGELHPLTIEVMKEIGIDLSGNRTKILRDVSQRDFDFVITLSERARSGCREFKDAEVIHWQFDDPSTSDPLRLKRMFESLRDQILLRIRLFALVQVRFTGVDTSSHSISAVGK
jgi:arsenate reductase